MMSKKLLLITMLVAVLVLSSVGAFAGTKDQVILNPEPGTYGEATGILVIPGSQKGEAGEIGVQGDWIVGITGQTNLWKPTSSTVASYGLSKATDIIDDIRVVNYIRNDLGLLQTAGDANTNSDTAYAATDTRTYNSNRTYTSDSNHTFADSGQVQTLWSQDKNLN